MSLNYFEGRALEAFLKCFCGCITPEQMSKLLAYTQIMTPGQLSEAYAAVCGPPPSCAIPTPGTGTGTPVVPGVPPVGGDCPGCGGNTGGGTPPLGGIVDKKTLCGQIAPLIAACCTMLPASDECNKITTALAAYCGAKDPNTENSSLQALCKMLVALSTMSPFNTMPAMTNPARAAAMMLKCAEQPTGQLPATTPPILNVVESSEDEDDGSDGSDENAMQLQSLIESKMSQVGNLDQLALQAAAMRLGVKADARSVLGACMATAGRKEIRTILKMAGITVGVDKDIEPEDEVALNKRELAGVRRSLTAWALNSTAMRPQTVVDSDD